MHNRRGVQSGRVRQKLEQQALIHVQAVGSNTSLPTATLGARSTSSRSWDLLEHQQSWVEVTPNALAKGSTGASDLGSTPQYTRNLRSGFRVYSSGFLLNARFGSVASVILSQSPQRISLRGRPSFRLGLCSSFQLRSGFLLCAVLVATVGDRGVSR
jgi:hypothetical protein